ncbi:hypothetical protein M2323_002382 [Rhodoblastus acidophilus]|uniref:caspase family protein n=1 Tax=Rhodoblastus acidophilus TaxID=1074 RepID=UPI002223FA67|nr:caspase family protein [Rhodoblastus acidophilus]MCW2286362.1 hypothetical protein [Rhodoblastus acidophilus]MCW2333448.1 hypothetical protein [Rhodoblastus acidophilus]
MRFLPHVAMVGACTLLFGHTASSQERAVREETKSTTRIALLIGNSGYRQEVPTQGLKAFKKLTNPCNDVTRIAAVLESANWQQSEMIQICDATRSQLSDAIAQFKDIYLSDDHALGFIYYAGHGVQVRNETYLFGVDSFLDPQKAARVATVNAGSSIFHGGVRLFSDLISQVGDAGDGSIFIVVDACRETPVDQLAKADPKIAEAYFNASRAYPRPALGIKLLYSTAYGELASDGLSGGSPFALAFEEHLKAEGRIDPLVARVIRSVKEKTINSKIQQLPDTTGSLNPPPPEGCLTSCGETK